MRRIPPVATFVVALAIAAMIALGLWQIRRLHWKQALLARYEANTHAPAIRLPDPATRTDAILFRHASASCSAPVLWHSEAGRDAQGAVGWRRIVRCAAVGDAPGLLVQIGIARDPQTSVDWSGGAISGVVTRAPDDRPLIADMFAPSGPAAPMLVADRPAPGLAANAMPDIASVPNNHLAYAVQWFVFALVAAIIYVLALRKRWQGRLARVHATD